MSAFKRPLVLGFLLAALAVFMVSRLGWAAKGATVDTNSVQTLTNKTLTSPVINGATYSAGTMRMGWAGSTTAAVSNSAANYFPANGVAGAQASNKGDVSSVVPWVATAKNLKCILTDAAGVLQVSGGTNYVVALQVNNQDSTLTCTMAGASSCADTSHTVTLAIGDQLLFGITPTGTPTALIPHCAFELDI